VNLLAIETSGDFCSVALSNGPALHARHFEAGQRHAELALDAIDALLREAGIGLAALQGIAYGEGPGSFTGLRIVCSLVQGLAFARELPVAGIGTLAALAEACGDDAVVACLDARMGEVYHAAYRRADDGWIEVSPPGLYRPGSVPQVEGEDWSGCGSGFGAHREALEAACGARLLRIRPEMSPTAEAVLRLARPRFLSGQARDAASAVPIYLRDKVALKTSERS
jgi:tRNA threonylcarbamoyladenosine biosynthesis protein TsaB